MKLLKVIAVMLLIFVASAFLTPVLQIVLPMFKFEKIFNRLIMVFTIAAAAIVVIRSQKKDGGDNFGPEFWRKNGFDFSAPWKKLALYGFLCGSLAVGLIVFWETVFGPLYARHPISLQDIVERFFKGMLSGAVVGIIEEFFFRGFVFQSLKKKLPLVLAIVLASAFYSMTHFFDNGQIFIPDHPTIRDSFRLLFGYLEPFQNRWADIFPQFFGLFIFGIVLCAAYLRTNSLFLSIGIHAGAVFAIKFQHSFIRQPLENLQFAFFGRSPDYDGSFEWLILALMGLIVWFVILPRIKLNSSRKPLR